MCQGIPRVRRRRLHRIGDAAFELTLPRHIVFLRHTAGELTAVAAVNPHTRPHRGTPTRGAVFAEVGGHTVMRANQLMHRHPHARKGLHLLLHGRQPLLIAAGKGVVANLQGIAGHNEFMGNRSIMAVEIVHCPAAHQLHG